MNGSIHCVEEGCTAVACHELYDLTEGDASTVEPVLYCGSHLPEIANWPEAHLVRTIPGPDERLAGIKADDESRLQVMAKLAHLHDQAQRELTAWATRDLPGHGIGVAVHGEAAEAALRSVARFASALAKVVKVEREAFDGGESSDALAEVFNAVGEAR